MATSGVRVSPTTPRSPETLMIGSAMAIFLRQQDLMAF